MEKLLTKKFTNYFLLIQNRKKISGIIAFLFIIQILSAQNQIPHLSIMSQSGNYNTQIELKYKAVDPDNINLEISCHLFDQLADGSIFPHAGATISGDTGHILSGEDVRTIQIHFGSTNAETKATKIILKLSDGESLNPKDILAQADSQLLKNHVYALEGMRVRSNSIFFKKSQDYIYSYLSAFHPTFVLEQNLNIIPIENIECRKSGFSNPQEIICLDAHYDCVSISPGADDNASGVAAVLEAARILKPYACNRSLNYLLFDAEELGLFGSKQYLKLLPKNNTKIKADLNFEMIGFYTEQPNTQKLPTGFQQLFPEAYNKVVQNEYRGDFITNVGNDNSKWLSSKIDSLKGICVPELNIITINAPGTGSIVPDLRRSDHASFWDSGIPAVMLTDGANFRNENYHTARDSAKFLNYGFMQHVLELSLATLIDLAGFEHASSQEIDIVKTVGTEELKSSFSAYYSDGIVYVQSQNSSLAVEADLYDAQGQKIRNFKAHPEFNQDAKIEVGYLSTGIYFLSIYNKNKSRLLKFVVHD